MPYCSNCGAKLPDNANFCIKCGTKVNDVKPIVQTQTTPVVQTQTTQVTQIPTQKQAYIPYDFSNIPIRYHCNCNYVFEGDEQVSSCPKCKAALNKGGYIQIYRIGNPMGFAVGMGIYIDGNPCGHLANKKSIRISVPYGSHQVHITHTATRKCNDPVFTISHDRPYVWCKAYFVDAGFAINVEEVSPDTMPTK